MAWWLAASSKSGSAAERHGCGRWPQRNTRTAHLHTATRRRGRLRWQRLPRAGGESSPRGDLSAAVSTNKPEGPSVKTHSAIVLALLTGIGLGAAAIQVRQAQVKTPAYVIGEIDVLDQDGYAREYQSRSAKPIIEEGGGKF